MLEQDYLLRLIGQFVRAMVHAMRKAGDVQALEELGAADGAEPDGVADPLGAAEMLEVAFGECVGMDQNTLLVLAPASLVGILQVSGTDPELVPHLVRCLELEAKYLVQGGLSERAALRTAQAEALSAGFSVPFSAALV